jgi:hypothetical protein
MDFQQPKMEIEQELKIRGSINTVFEQLIYVFSEGMAYEDGRSMNMKLERRPGGRWFRDLGNDSGHLWGFVQSIKPPTLLELYGQLFMSGAAANHIMMRLTEAEDGTVINFRHSALEEIDDEMKQNMSNGWKGMLEVVRKRCE